MSACVRVVVGPLRLEVEANSGLTAVLSRWDRDGQDSSSFTLSPISVQWLEGTFPLAGDASKSGPTDSSDFGTRFCRQGEYFLLADGTQGLRDGPYFSVIDRNGGTVAIYSASSPSNWQTVRRELVLAADYFLLTQHAAAVVHGACFRLGERAGAFLGPSGAGKSTALGLVSKLADPIADDLFVATAAKDGARAFSTSLDRAFTHSKRSALAALFLPTKAAGFRLARLSPRQALLRYLSENSQDIGRIPPCLRRMLLPWLYSLFQAVPVYDFAFTTGFVDLAAIEAVLSEVAIAGVGLPPKP